MGLLSSPASISLVNLDGKRCKKSFLNSLHTKEIEFFFFSFLLKAEGKGGSIFEVLEIGKGRM